MGQRSAGRGAALPVSPGGLCSPPALPSASQFTSSPGWKTSHTWGRSLAQSPTHSNSQVSIVSNQIVLRVSAAQRELCVFFTASATPGGACRRPRVGNECESIDSLGQQSCQHRPAGEARPLCINRICAHAVVQAQPWRASSGSQQTLMSRVR